MRRAPQPPIRFAHKKRPISRSAFLVSVVRPVYKIFYPKVLGTFYYWFNIPSTLRRPSLDTLPVNEGVGVADFKIAFFTCCQEAFG